MKGLMFHPTELTITSPTGTTRTQKTYMVFAEDFETVWKELNPSIAVPSAFVQEVKIDDRIVPTVFIRYEAGNGGKPYYHPHFEGITRQGDIRSMSVEEAKQMLKSGGIPIVVRQYLEEVVAGNIEHVRMSKGQYNPPKKGVPQTGAQAVAPADPNVMNSLLDSIR